MSEQTVEEEGGSSKIFLVLGLLLGVGIGAGAGFFYFGGSSEQTEEEAETVKEEAREPLTSISFERIAVPIYATRGNSRRYIGNYFIDLTVNVRGAENQITVKREKSLLQHAFISAISRAELMREDSPTELDLDKAAKILNQKAQEVLGAGIIESISITKSVRIST